MNPQQCLGAVTITTSSLPQNELSHVNCIIVLGDEGKFDGHVRPKWPWFDLEIIQNNSALSPDDESIKDEDLYFDQSNERIIEGASSPDMSATNSSSDSVTNGLWGIRIKIEALDVIPEEFRYLKFSKILSFGFKLKLAEWNGVSL